MSSNEEKDSRTASDFEELAARLRDTQREVEVLRRIVDAAPVMLYQWVLSASGEARFTFVSRGCEEIYGLTTEQMLADVRYSLEVIHREDMPGFQQAVASSAQELIPFFWEGRVVVSGERTKWLRARSVPTRLPDGSTLWEGVIVDITEQHQAEAARTLIEHERSALIYQLREQNVMLKRQAETLRELATPIIPLANDVIALPLIGDIDPLRAQQIIEALLEGISAYRARVAIIDITGVRTLDVYGAQSLVRAAQALRLLGATTILTGLRPAIAQTLVTLGVDLGGLLTRSTFQDGIVFALGLRTVPSKKSPNS